MQQSTVNHIKKSVVWVTPVLGVDGKLLYLGPLLNQLVTVFDRLAVYTAEFIGDEAQAEFPIVLAGRFVRLYANERHSMQQTTAYAGGISVATPGIITRLVREKPDLLIINEFSLYSFYALLAKLFIPGMRALCIVEARPRVRQGRLLGMARKAFRTLLCRMADAFLTNNIDGKLYLMELGAKEEQITCRPYLVSDLSRGQRVERDKNNMPSEKVVFLYVGQLLKRKGLQHALAACELLKTKYPHQFLFRIVGDGPYRSELEAVCDSQGLSEHVEFLGRQPYESLHRYYADAHAFLFPTLCDYRALSPFEALSHGLAILASREDGGISETVSEGKNGFSFEPGDPANIAEKMEFLITHRDKIRDFSHASYEIAAHYTLDSAISALTEAASNALKGS